MEKIIEANTVISLDSSVKIVTRLEPGQSGFCSWQGEINFSSPLSRKDL